MLDAPPRPVLLVVLACCTLAAGFGLARASLDVDRARQAMEQGALPEPGGAIPEAPGAADEDAEAEAAVLDTPVGSSDVGTVGDARGSDAGTGAPEPGLGQTPSEVRADGEPAAPTTPLVVRHGRVAYIRCGADEAPTPGSCPRSHGLERRVWEAIDRLTSCPAIGDALGAADVRVVYDGGRYSGIGFRPLADDALDVEQVRGCLEETLRGTTLEGRTERLTVAFRFDLVR